MSKREKERITVKTIQTYLCKTYQKNTPWHNLKIFSKNLEKLHQLKCKRMELDSFNSQSMIMHKLPLMQQIRRKR